MEMKGLIQELRSDILKYAVKTGDFTLASGAKSTYYIDLSNYSLSTKGMHAIAKAFHAMVLKLDFDAIGGPVLGACPLVCGLVARFPFQRGFFVRKATKEHGNKSLIEGELKPKDKVIILEDVVTSGKSVLDAAKHVRDDLHCEVVGIYSVIDRLSGAAELFDKHGFKFETIFDIQDLGLKNGE